MVLGTVHFNNESNQSSIDFYVLSTSKAVPTFVFAPHKHSDGTVQEITAYYQFGKWWLNCSHWLVNKEQVRNYCIDKLSVWV